MHIVKVEVLVGTIGSAKSTYARSRAKDGAWIICHDQLVTMFHGGYEYHQEWRGLYESMEEELVTGALQLGRDIVIDRTHLNYRARQRWVDFLAKYRRANPRGLTKELVAVVFPMETPEIHAERRFSSDPRGLSYDRWLEVTRGHFDHAMNSHIGIKEGFDRLEYKEYVDGGFRECSPERIWKGVDDAKFALVRSALDQVSERERLRKMSKPSPADPYTSS